MPPTGAEQMGRLPSRWSPPAFDPPARHPNRTPDTPHSGDRGTELTTMPAAAVRRPTGVIAIAIALVAFELAWLLAEWRHRPHHPVLGWLPVISAAMLSTYACRRTAR